MTPNSIAPSSELPTSPASEALLNLARLLARHAARQAYEASRGAHSWEAIND